MRRGAGIVRRSTIALVVPGVVGDGGVPAVARFIRDTILRCGLYNLKVVSLSMSSEDPVSMRLTAPQSWVRGAHVATGMWEGVAFVHVGAVAGDVEFQRYRPRRVLAQVLAGCDLVQVVCGSPAWANAAVGLGIPVAVQVATRARVERRQRDANPQTLAALWRKVMTVITDRMDDNALRRVNAIQVENQWMLDYARELNAGREVDLRYAPPGVDATLFHPLPRREPKHEPYILCVARLGDPRKRALLLLEAYALLPDSARCEVRLVLAGATEPPESFWRRSEALGLRERITYYSNPSRGAIVSLYQGASVFALPSDEEGLGMVVLEAMACGVPVVSTRSGGPDGIITDGEDGYLVPLDDAPALARRLNRLLSDPVLNINMGRQARNTIETRFTEEVAGVAFLDVWDRLLSQQGEES